VSRGAADVVAGIVSVVGVAGPLLVCVAYRGDFLDLANESTAYRYFFTVRVAAGETVVVGVGYLLAAIQDVIYAVLRTVDGGPEGLRQQIQGFALATNGVLTGAMTAILAASYRDRTLRSRDWWLVAMVALVPVWATRVTGFDYALMADYHLLNLVLVTGATWLFLREWRREPAPPSGGRAFALGLGVGAAMANKITLAVVGAPLVAAVVFAAPFDLARGARRAWAVAAGAISGFLLVILASYRFNAAALGEMLPVWLAFVTNAGGERQFWTSTFGAFIFSHGYATIGLFFCLAIALFLRQTSRHAWTTRERALVAIVILAALGSVWFVIERPAGSTLFESSVFVLALATMLVGAANDLPRWVIPAAGGFWLLYAASTFDWRESFDMVRLSRSRAELKWDHYAEVRRLAQDRPITVVFPDNSFHHEGVFEFLLKGAVEFPTWRIADRGRQLLQHYSPGLSYRHDLDAPRPDQPYDGNTVLVWYVSATTDPIAKYETLAQAITRCTHPPREWTLEGKAGQTRVLARSCVLSDVAGH
jgi:hypothetical protein